MCTNAREKICRKIFKMSSLDDRFGGNLILFLKFFSGFLSLTMNIRYLYNKNWFSTMHMHYYHIHFHGSQQEKLQNFRNISSFVLYRMWRQPINWILFHYKYYLRQVLNMNTCTTVMQKECVAFYAESFPFPHPDPHLPRSPAWSVSGRPGFVDWINGLHKPGCQLGLANGEPWQDIRESEIVVFISFSLPGCCCSFCISLWKAPAPARWPSLPLTLSLWVLVITSFLLPPSPGVVSAFPCWPGGTSLSLWTSL